jgi:CHAT domain-containing protein
LPYAVKEAEAVTRHLGAAGTLLTDEAASRAHVTKMIVNVDRMHFAGHATSDAANPIASSLALYDGPLRVGDLLAMHLDGTELGFLSACSTASAGDLHDESIHITSALQVIGFRHVVGTLWPIADDVAYRVADRFYALVGEHGPAAAINRASREIRARYPLSPLLWASHLHVGP